MRHNDFVVVKNYKLRPVILFALSNTDVSDESSILICLKIVQSLLDAQDSESSVSSGKKPPHELILPYIAEILSKLSVLAKYEHNMQVRLMALVCLNSVACSLSPNVIIPYQASVIAKLQQCLNDRKRLCRQKAVETRDSIWR